MGMEKDSQGVCVSTENVIENEGKTQRHVLYASLSNLTTFSNSTVIRANVFLFRFSTAYFIL